VIRVPTYGGSGALAGAAGAGDRDVAERRSRSNTALAGSAQTAPNAPPNSGCGGLLPIPAVSEADALSDRVWFAQHPERTFRHRLGTDDRVWIVRRAGDVLLRVPIAGVLSAPLHDNDRELGPTWFAAAWPELSAEEAQRRGRRAARQGPRRRP
jgi:hypothetical protein